MKCYYEILGVSKTVEAADLKKAYYKMSLKWHPDKNALDDDTTGMFQQIQEAYRVLSDPHERAWYDNHRAEILQSNGSRIQRGGTSTEFTEERVDVFEYFVRSCYGAFDDSPKGFYTVYRKVFLDITDEEMRAREFSHHSGSESLSESSDDSNDNDTGDQSEIGDRSSVKRQTAQKRSGPYPTFGNAKSDYTSVVAPFYHFWETFRTRKSYSWVEKYDTRCADSRAERRAMETENRRLRDVAKRKRTDEVRQLVAFVKKRDPRVEQEQERIKVAAREAQLRSQHRAKETRQREATELAEAWNEELTLGSIAAQGADYFETELARIEAELDGVKLNSTKSVTGLDGYSDYDSNATDTDGDVNNDTDELYCYACEKAFASFGAKQSHDQSKKHKKQMQVLREILLSEQAMATESEEVAILLEDLDMNDDAPFSNDTYQEPVKLTKRAKKSQRKQRRETEKQSEVNDQPNEVVTSIDMDGFENKVPESVNNYIDIDGSSSPSGTTQRSHVTAHAKRLNQKNTEKPAVCENCHMSFDSRNALFTHLKESGHARLKPCNSSSGVPSKPKKQQGKHRVSDKKSKG